MASTKKLSFQVTRKNSELIPPAKPTPHEFKPLSEIDDQEGLRFQIPAIQFYRRNPSMEGKDPVKVIRDAVARALVFYYPLAGRLREFAGRKLVVECTGEGVVFIEADADVTLQQFGDTLCPPFPCLEELLYDVPGTAGIINCPLLLIQVTRLKCGGFIFALRFNHTMSDATGLVQFMSAVGELARGSKFPSIAPIWQRHLLSARNPPRVTCTHHEYNAIPNAKEILMPLDDMVERSFLFRATDISALRNSLPPHLRRCSNFELVLAFVWRCRTIALSPNPNEVVRISCLVNIRKRFSPPLPVGYYGNALVYPAAVTTAEKLSKNALHYALELVKTTKSQATEEYVKSAADLMVIKDRPIFVIAGNYIVSDLTRMGFDEVDFGWGNAVYGGLAKCSVDSVPGIINFFVPIKNKNGENEIAATICLPAKAMEVFMKELEITMLAARRRRSIKNVSAL